MLRHVALVRTDFSEEIIFPIINVTGVSELVFLDGVPRLLVFVNLVPSSLIFISLMMEAIRSSETSVLTRVTRRHTPEDGFHHHSLRQRGTDGKYQAWGLWLT
jgi:hypothetical protein